MQKLLVVSSHSCALLARVDGYGKLSGQRANLSDGRHWSTALTVGKLPKAVKESRG